MSLGDAKFNISNLMVLYKADLIFALLINFLTIKKVQFKPTEYHYIILVKS